MKSKKVKRLSAMLMASAMMVATLGMSVCAEGANTDVATNNMTVPFTKTLNMNSAEGASVPDVTFEYTITPVTDNNPNSDVLVAATSTSPEILEGVGSPTVGNAAFTHSDNTSNLTKQVNVSFSSGTFTKPGIYRYKITENATSNTDITNDANPDRYLDVYVVYDNQNNLVIEHSVLLNTNTTPIYDSTTGAPDYGTTNKSTGYTNSYKTYSLTLDKVVKGNMGDKTRDYKFTINFEGPANASFTCDSTIITLDANGKGSYTFNIKDADDAIEIKGIPSTVKYTVIENINNNDGYTTTAKVNSTSITEVNDSDNTKVTFTEQIMGKNNNAVVVTNEKNSSTPTGIITTIAPFAIMVILAAAVAVVFLRRRNRAEF